MFISPGHARELALMPGTTVYRLLTHRADGRIVERTIEPYSPDTDMRRQILAADVYSRAPGTRTGAHASELDHVTPYGWAGGPTGEFNLALLAKRPHQFKTEDLWQATIGDRRDLQFTTLLGQLRTSRVHDYRQYTRHLDGDDLEAIRDRANRAIYDTLAADPAHRYRRAPSHDDRHISLTHTDGTGLERPGPPPPAQPPPDAGRDGDAG